MKFGIIGMSLGNGHPYSFSAIINGYSKEGFLASDWAVILNYLEKQSPSEIGLENCQVTHVWTQDRSESEKLSIACFIDNICDCYSEMIGSVDAVIIARDDYDHHYEISKVFLEKNIPVFIDKPLTLNSEDIPYFQPFLNSGKLMSCSGFRYARELDTIKESILPKNKIIFISATVVNCWEKYGVHMLESIFSFSNFDVKSVEYISAGNTGTYVLRNNDDSHFNINILGSSTKTFSLNIWTDIDKYSISIDDNFTAFKRMLKHFSKMVDESLPPIDPQLTLKIQETLIAGRQSRQQQRLIEL